MRNTSLNCVNVERVSQLHCVSGADNFPASCNANSNANSRQKATNQLFLISKQKSFLTGMGTGTYSTLWTTKRWLKTLQIINKLPLMDCLTKTNPYVAVHCWKALSLRIVRCPLKVTFIKGPVSKFHIKFIVFMSHLSLKVLDFTQVKIFSDMNLQFINIIGDTYTI